MPSPISPLARICTIAWYHASVSHFKTTTYFSTTNRLYDATYDESISPDQCAKWAKGQRCSPKWIPRLNHKLPQICKDTYEIGPCGESLWPAFRLPSSLYHTSLILMPACDYPTRPPQDGKYHNEKIAMLAIEVAGWMIAAEGFLFATLAKNNDDDASWFHAMSKRKERIINDPSQMLARLEATDKQADALVAAANAAKAELEAVGLSADLICRTAYLQFMFLVKKQYPSAKQGYLRQMKLAKFATRPPLRLMPKAA